MMKLPTLFTVVFLFFQVSSFASAPTHDAPLDSTEVKFSRLSDMIQGGFSIGARVGTSSYLYFSPFIGITKGKWSPAIGITFSQYIQNYPYLKEERIGVRAMCRYQVMKYIFSSIEYDGQKNAVARQDGFKKEWTNNVFLGIGTKFNLTEVTAITLELLYHMNYAPGESPYGFKQTLGRIGLVF